MLWKKYLKDYLSFGKRDRIGILSILCLICLVYLVPFFSRPGQELSLENAEELNQAMDSLRSVSGRNRETNDHEWNAGFAYKPSPYPDKVKRELFRFDPNSLGMEGWQRLGLSERTSRTIENFRNKGGRFYKPEDLQKIWGLPPGFYDRVKTYISIEPIARPAFEDQGRPRFQGTEKMTRILSINEADSTAFIELPGIGARLASRIINFRNRLGGFHSVDQVSETYGLPDSTFQKIKPLLQVDGEVKKININQVNKDELKKHPYFKWNLVNAVIAYRDQHGPFKSIEELKKIMLVDEALFNKIKPYLTIDQ